MSKSIVDLINTIVKPRKTLYFLSRVFTTGLAVISLLAAGLLACITTRAVSADVLKEDDLPSIPLSESLVQTQPFLDFVETVRDDSRANEPSGLYANENWHFEIVEPEEGADPAEVPYMVGHILHFSYADRTGSLGLIAHNMPEGGARFYELGLGQELVVVKGDGNYTRYQIIEQSLYQALDSKNPKSDFIQDGTTEIINANQLFYRIYSSPPSKHLVLQTCYERDGNSAWGRSFWIAKRLDVSQVPFGSPPPATATAFPTPQPTLTMTPDPRDAELVTKAPLPDRQPTALCRDGWTSYATEEQKPHVCSRHQGLNKWLDQPMPTATAAP